MLPKLPRERLIDLCRRMFLIRHFEKALVGLYGEGRFRGEYHLYIGQEAIGGPVLSCLEGRAYVFSTHRNHGHLLARGAEPGRLLAEILGRLDGYNKGKGGTFHTAVASLGVPHISAIVAGMIPLAAGAAVKALM
jgi:TPP-dependent pyruvate/acetoin dehydrogenase alpha subunit